MIQMWPHVPNSNLSSYQKGVYCARAKLHNTLKKVFKAKLTWYILAHSFCSEVDLFL